MLKNHLIIAWRNLLRNKQTSFINVLGMALGITCCLVIFKFVSYEFSFDDFHAKAKRTYRVVEQMAFPEGIEYRNTTAYPLAEALRNDFPQLQYITQAHGPVQGIITINRGHEQVDRFEEDELLFVDPFYFQVFDFTWLEGIKETALDDPQSVILTRSSALKYFPDYVTAQNSILGRIIYLKLRSGIEGAFKVTGLLEDPPPNMTLRYELVLPFEFFKQEDPYRASNWSGNYQGTTFLTLAPDQDAQELGKSLLPFKKKYLKPEDEERKAYYLQPITEMHTDVLYGSSPGSYVLAKKYLYGLMVLALLILGLASANFVNLATAQAIKRAKEVGIRKVLGSSRLQLFRQFIGETFIISMLAVLLAILLSGELILRLNEFLGLIKLQLSFDVSLWLIALGLAFLITLIAGFYPALILSRYSSIKALKLKFNAKQTGHPPLRKTLVVLQFAICQVLLAGTLIVAWQMNYLKTKELGYAKEAIVNVSVPEYDIGKLETFRSRLLQNPNIRRVSFASGVPTSDQLQLGTSFRLKGNPETTAQSAEMKVVDTEYLDTYELKLIAGNGLTDSNKSESFNGFVVNESLVKSLGLTPEEAIGQEVAINEGEAPIIGVVADFHNVSLKEEITPCLLFYWYTDFFFDAGIKIEPQHTTATLSFIEQTFRSSFPEGFYNYQFLDDYLAKIYVLEDLLLQLVRISALFAVIIACLGLYGLITFSTTQRIKEIGIRKVLGASFAHIVKMFSYEFVKLIAVAFLIATPVSWFFMQQWLQGFVYRIEFGLGIFLVTIALILLISFITVGTKLWQAARADPADSLRYE